MMEPRGYGASAVVTGRPEGVGAEFAYLFAELRINLLRLSFAPTDETVARCRRRGLAVCAAALDLTAIGIVDQTGLATTDLEVDLKLHHGVASTCTAESPHARPCSVAGNRRSQYQGRVRPGRPLRQRPRRVTSHGVSRGQGIQSDLHREPLAAGVHGWFEWPGKRRVLGAVLTTATELASVAILQQRNSLS
jgi:hypothetical protein